MLKQFRLSVALARAKRALAGPLDDRLQRRISGRLGSLDGGTEGDAAIRKPSVPLPSGATVERDVAYGSDPAQQLDVYRPVSASGAPIIFYVHGGGWRRGDKAMPQMVRNKVAHWVTKGFVLVSTNYRMLPAANVVEQAEDVGRSLAFVQSKARAWGGDPACVIVIGHSAGAHLVSMITADVSLATRHGAKAWLATVALDSAALDVESVMNRLHYRFYDSVFGTDPVFWREASPIRRIEGKLAAPMLIVCSSKRGDSCSPAREFAAKAMGDGGRVTVLPVALTHIQINDELGARSDYTDAVDAFLRTAGVP